MNQKELGYNNELAVYRSSQGLEGYEVGRVIVEHRERYVVKSLGKDYDAELIGRLRFSTADRHDLPAVGDWVAFSEYDENKALIHEIYPRKSIIERQAVGLKGQVQIIATNVDIGLIVQAVDRDFNLNRIERYLTICYTSKVTPLVILSKVDLVDKEELESLLAEAEQRLGAVKILTVSSETIGYNAIEEIMEVGMTYCLLGSSGVGKSTILNHLLGRQQMKTAAISTSVNKGRHVTSHRELVVLEGGGILIDNPGMREVGIADSTSGIELAFQSILELELSCAFKDCTHSNEKDCAVIEAIEKEELDLGAYENFLKLRKEQAHFESDAIERKKKDKDLARLIKQVKLRKKRSKG